MPDYHGLYLKLFGAQADAMDGLRAITESLERAHREAEESVINAPDPEIRLMRSELENGG